MLITILINIILLKFLQTPTLFVVVDEEADNSDLAVVDNVDSADTVEH